MTIFKSKTFSNFLIIVLSLLIGSTIGIVLPSVLREPLTIDGPVEGERELWIVPVLPAGSPPGPDNTKVILRQANAYSEYYEKISKGKVTFKATKVLNPIYADLLKATRETNPEYGNALNNGVVLNDCSQVEDQVFGLRKTVPPNVTIIGLAEMSWKCPYGGKAALGGRQAIVLGYDPITGVFPETVFVHELGHTLGLSHAKETSCPAMVESAADYPAECEINEYGDWASPMGDGRISRLASLTALELNVLGWGDGITKISEPGDYIIPLPAVSGPETDGIELPGGYVLSYRAETGPSVEQDSALNEARDFFTVEGVYLTKREPASYEEAEHGVAIPFTPGRQPGTVGDHYVNLENGFSFRIIDIIEGEYASVELVIGPEAGDFWGPALTVMRERYTDGTSIIRWYGFDSSGITEVYTKVDDGPLVVRRDKHHILVGINDEEYRTVSVIAYDKAGNSTVKTVLVPPLNKKRNQHRN